MKKNNGGYALPFALVVIVIMGLIASAVLSYSLNNYVSQKNTTQRMIDRSVAQGEIEKVKLLLEERPSDLAFGQSRLKVFFDALGMDENSYTLTEVKNNGVIEHLLLEVRASSGSVLITCTFRLEGVIEITGYDTDNNPIYKYSDLKVEYEDYEITSAEGGGSDG